MTQKQKGLVGLAVMLVLAVIAIFGSDSIYRMIDNSGREALSFTPGTYTGTAEGYGGDVVAVVTVSDKKIESIELTGDGETPAIGGDALEKLTASFLDSQSAQVDIISGATITSNAAIQAVESALAQAGGSAPVASTEETTEITTTVETTEAVTEVVETEPEVINYRYLEGIYTAIAEGYAGDIIAEVEIDQDGKVVAVELTGDDETPEIGGAALEKIGAAFVEKQSANIDVISGATISCEAAMEAVQIALEDAKEYFDEGGEDLSEISLAAGTFTGSYRGYGGDVLAEIEISEDGVIESVTLSGAEETPEIGGEALMDLEQQFVDRQSTEIDVITGATKTCDAAIQAVEEAIMKAEEAYGEQ